MSKKTATEERTYTLADLAGKPERWWHYRRSGARSALCGHPVSGRNGVPVESAVEGRDCPDCVRIFKQRGWS